MKRPGRPRRGGAFRRASACLLLAGTVPVWPAHAGEPDGAATFAGICKPCHQEGGVGAPGLAPPLAGTLAARLATPEGRNYVRGVLLNGMSGSLGGASGKFSGAMPSQARLPDAQLAAVANYVAQSFNGLADPPFTAADFAQGRSVPLDHKTLRRLRAESERP